MNALRGLRAAVAGGGVFGLTTAVRFAEAGARVTLYDPQPLAARASAVAAGMLAPAFEAALDPPSSGHFPLLRDARELWPGFLSRLGAPASLLDRSGALWVAADGEEETLERIGGHLAAEGAAVERLAPVEALTLQPQLTPSLAGALFTPDDWRIDSLHLLSLLAERLTWSGGARVDARLSVDAAQAFDLVVLATGANGGDWLAEAPELGLLHPIKGQILHYEAPPQEGPTVRGRSGYVAPQGRGAVAGATMEVGLVDARPDPQVLARLRTDAARLFPHLATAQARGAAGIRASTSDGLPIVGRSLAVGSREERPGRQLLLAAGARRNGWLLAPLVAEILLAQVAGEDDSLRVAPTWAAALDPTRFTTRAVQPEEYVAVPGS